MDADMADIPVMAGIMDMAVMAVDSVRFCQCLLCWLYCWWVFLAVLW